MSCSGAAAGDNVSRRARHVSRLVRTAGTAMFLGSLVGTLAGGARGAGAVDMALYVTFQPNRTITVTFLDGAPVGTASGTPTLIPAGFYTLHLDDSAAVAGPSFDLRGPGVNVVDDMFFGESPSTTHGVTFQPNSTYTWRDDESPGAVFTFATSAAVASSSTSTSSGTSTNSGSSTSSSVVGSAIKPLPFRGTLSGLVSAAGTLTLTRAGKGVTTIKSGRYSISVDDKSSKRGFLVQEARKQPETLTGSSFVGKRKVTVALKAGQWLFYSASGAKNYFVVSS